MENILKKHEILLSLSAIYDLFTKNKKDGRMIKKFVKSTVIGFLFLALCATATAPLKKDLKVKDVLFSSIAWIESTHNPKAVSRDGSVGIVQIKSVMVKEVNRICQIKGIEKKFSLADRNNKEKSKEMFWIYQKFYNPDINLNDISEKEMELIARKWNGGPNGHRKKATKKYWNKVIKRINYEMAYDTASSLD